MNIIADVTIGSTMVGNHRVVYYGAQDETLVWRHFGDHDDRIVARVAGGLAPYRQMGRNTFLLPDASEDGQDVLIVENGCACNHAYKRWWPPHPDADPEASLRPIREQRGVA